MRSSTESTRPTAAVADRADSPAAPRQPGKAPAAGGAERKSTGDRSGVLAASLAYYWILALLSVAVALLGLLGLLHLSAGAVKRLNNGVFTALPVGVNGPVSRAIGFAAGQSHSSSIVALTAGIVVALWTALGGISALQTHLGVAYKVPASRSLVARWFCAVPLLLCTVVLGGAAAALLVFGQPLGTEIDGHIGVTGGAFVALWTAVRWVVAVVLFTILLACYYSFGTSRRSTRWRWVSWGGLMATAIFVIVSAGCSIYISSFGHHGRVYGTAVGAFSVVVWLYLVSFAILVGAKLNAPVAPVRPPVPNAVPSSAGQPDSGIAGTALSLVPSSSPVGTVPPAQPVPEYSLFQPRKPKTAAQPPESASTLETEQKEPAAKPQEPAAATAGAKPQEPAAATAGAKPPEPDDAAAAEQQQQQQQLGQPQDLAPAARPAQRQSAAPTAQEAEPAAKAAKPQAQSAILTGAGTPDGGLPPLPRRVPGQSLRERRRLGE